MSTRAASFPHRLAGHCGSGALRDLLELHGLDYGSGPLSEGAVFGFGGGLGFFLLEMPDVTPAIYLVGRTADLERNVAAHLGAGLEVREGDDASEGWRWVKEEVDAGRPPMVWADIAELEYLNVKMSNTRHDIVIVDYDEDAGVAVIADNDREELQRCSLTSLAAARRSFGFPGPNRHTTFVYDWPERLRDPDQATRTALEQAIRNMRNPKKSPVEMPGAQGLRGIDRLAAVYPVWPETLDDALPGALGALRVFIVKAGTGGAMFRSLHAEFLRDVSGLLGGSALRDAAKLYDELSGCWRSLADCAGARDHAAGVPHVMRIAELEHAGVAAMEVAAAEIA